MLVKRVISSTLKFAPMSQLNFRNACSNFSAKTYENAIAALNSLQSNSAALSLSIKLKRHQLHNEENYNLRDTEKFLEKIDGFSLDHLDNLSVIHVSGSKGKGSVCSFTDAILREYGVKTGLFTSPHLISVTERIKLSGCSISKIKFNKYFWEVYNALYDKKTHETDMPSYFKFLQIMAFYIFVKEKVDVAIVEVGIGGQYDSTNIIRNTEIVGITALHLEHTQLLGDKIEDIAWQKAGIIKKGSDVFFMNQSDERALKVIQNRFIELNGKRLSMAPPINAYKWNNCTPDFTQHTAEVNNLNFSLAAQLSGRWLRNRNKLSDDYFIGNKLITIEEKFVRALQKCHFEGRFQKIYDDGITFYLDGAHTIESMQICGEWFAKQIGNMKNSINVLIFNVTGERDAELMLKQLHSIHFDLICFSTNIADNENINEHSESFSVAFKDSQLERCFRHKKIWMNMHNEKQLKACVVQCCSTIQNAIDCVYSIKENNYAHLNVLLTGSLHLVGGSLKIIEKIQKEKRVKSAKEL